MTSRPFVFRNDLARPAATTDTPPASPWPTLPEPSRSASSAPHETDPRPHHWPELLAHEEPQGEWTSALHERERLRRLDHEQRGD